MGRIDLFGRIQECDREQETEQARLAAYYEAREREREEREEAEWEARRKAAAAR
jgi:hypothetical protein